MTEVFLRFDWITVAVGFQIAAGLTSLLSVWCMGNKRISGPVMGLVSQSVWFAFIYTNAMWGLLPLTCCMTVIQVRNLRKWRREGRVDAAL